MSRLGRKARPSSGVDTRPGKILLLALVANAPIALGFILAPLASGGNPAAARAFVPFVLWGTPIVAAGAIALYVTAKPEPRAHRAARMGMLLAVVALMLWAFVLLLSRRA